MRDVSSQNFLLVNSEKIRVLPTDLIGLMSYDGPLNSSVLLRAQTHLATIPRGFILKSGLKTIAVLGNGISSKCRFSTSQRRWILFFLPFSELSFFVVSMHRRYPPRTSRNFNDRWFYRADRRCEQILLRMFVVRRV